MLRRGRPGILVEVRTTASRSVIAAAARGTLAAGSARVERIFFADPPPPPELDYEPTELGVTDVERRRTRTERRFGPALQRLHAERYEGRPMQPGHMVYSGTAIFAGGGGEWTAHGGDPAAPRRGNADPVWIVEALQFVDLAEALERREAVRGDRCRRFRFRIDLARHRSQLDIPPHRGTTRPRLTGDVWVGDVGRIRRVTWTRIDARRPRAPFQCIDEGQHWQRTELWHFGVEASIEVPDVEPDRTPWPIALAKLIWWIWGPKRAGS